MSVFPGPDRLLLSSRSHICYIQISIMYLNIAPATIYIWAILRGYHHHHVAHCCLDDIFNI